MTEPDAFLHWLTFAILAAVNFSYFVRVGQLRDRPGNTGADFAARLMVGLLMSTVVLGLGKRAIAGDEFEAIHWPILIISTATLGTYVWMFRTDALAVAQRDANYERWGVMSTTVVRPASRWGKAFWADFGERVGSTFLYAVLTLLLGSALPAFSFEALWPILGLPVALAAVKGLLANMRAAESGASLLPAGAPGPVLTDERPDYTNP